MTSPTPTDRGAVERLREIAHRDEAKAVFVRADDLRALLAERDHADAHRQAAVAEMRDAAADMASKGHHPRAIRDLPAPTDALDRAIEAAAERAFKDGITYATICEVSDPDEAWRTSACRAAIRARSDKGEA